MDLEFSEEPRCRISGQHYELSWTMTDGRPRLLVIKPLNGKTHSSFDRLNLHDEHGIGEVRAILEKFLKVYGE